MDTYIVFLLIKKIKKKLKSDYSICGPTLVVTF